MYVQIAKTLYTRAGKKYIDVRLNNADKMNVCAIHNKHYMNCDTPFFNPLDDDVLTVKVPFKWHRPTYKHQGIKTIFEVKEGDLLKAEVEFKGLWKLPNSHGFSWQLVSMNTESILPPKMSEPIDIPQSRGNQNI